MNEQIDKGGKPTVVKRCCRWLFGWRTIRRALIGLACFATVVALFYTEENWRGKRAWENCKHELEAKGVVLDWSAYIPPPVPDNQNFFKAPGINEADWVGRGSREFTKHLSSASQSSNNPMLVAELKVVPSNTKLDVENGGTILRLEDSDARKQAEQLIRAILGPSAVGTRGFYPLIARPLNQVQPAVAVVPLDKMHTAQEILKIFPDTIAGSHVQIKLASANSFSVFLSPPPIAARDYLQASDASKADFDNLRKALERPYTRIDGDYTQPATMPIPNFITMRTVAQILAERAKCYLLLGQPDKGLRELTLLHDVCRVLESKPTGKPMTLVAAMINVAITRLYTDTVTDGMRLQTLREPQLAVIENQLSEINLLPYVVSAFEQEPAAVCRTLEISPASKLAAMFFFDPPNPNLKEKLKNPTYFLIRWMPRGWVYQNMVNIAMSHQKIAESFEPASNLVLPRKAEMANGEIGQLALRHGPYTFLAAITLPNYTKAMQRLAYNQTSANETLLACALERFRLARGEFPETLDALTPQFIEKRPHDLIGGQPLHYRRTDDGKFLLYSIGWNEKDDGGEVALNQEGKEDLENGDWVWSAK